MSSSTYEWHELVSSFHFTLTTLGLNPLYATTNNYLDWFAFLPTAAVDQLPLDMSATCHGDGQGAADTVIYDGVIFKSLEDSYPTDGEIVIQVINKLQNCMITDKVALFTITSETEPLATFDCSSGTIEANTVKLTLKLSSIAEKLPDDELYHLSYICNGKSFGSSTSFRIVRPNFEDFVEFKTQDASDDEEFIVIKSEKALFQERLNQLVSENGLLEFRNRSLNDRVKLLEDELNKFKCNNSKDQSIIKILENENSTLNRRVDVLKNEKSDLKVSLDLMNKNVEKYRNLAKVHAEEFEEMKKSKNLLQKEYSECLVTLEKRVLERADLLNRLKSSQELIRDLQMKVAEEIKVNYNLSQKLKSTQGTNARCYSPASAASGESASTSASPPEAVADLKAKIEKLTFENNRLAREHLLALEQKAKAESRLAKFQSKIEVSSPLNFHQE